MKSVNKDEFESTSQLFIAAVKKYFNHLSEVTPENIPPTETGVPFIKERNNIALKEFTGMIGISGNRKGFVYFSGDKALYQDLIKIFVRRDDASDDQILDMAGEVSNVVAGNVKETFGNDFMISVPLVFKGKPQDMKFANDIPAFVIPISWRGHEACIVIGLE